MRRVAFLAIAGLIAACSLFVDLGGLRDTDGGSSDAFAPADVVSEQPTASDAADAGPDVFDFKCPDAAIICDDFDESPLGARWSGQRITSAMLEISDAAAVSPPNSLLVTLPPNPSSAARYARLEQNLSNLSTLDCELTFRIDATTATGSQDVRPIELDLNVGGFSYWEVWVDLRATELSFVQNNDPSGDAGPQSRSDFIAGGLTVGTWRHLRFKTDFKRAQFALDGTQVFDRALMSPISQGSGKLFVGMTYDAQSPAWTYRIDDVLCVGN
jgi:hypothetical protein